MSIDLCAKTVETPIVIPSDRCSAPSGLGSALGGIDRRRCGKDLSRQSRQETTGQVALLRRPRGQQQAVQSPRRARISRLDGRHLSRSANTSRPADDPAVLADDDLAAPPLNSGELRWLGILFADVVGSTELSTRVAPETYFVLVRRYRQLVTDAVAHFDGRIISVKGDGLLAVFDHPYTDEDDALRAVAAGLAIADDVARLGNQALRRFGVDIAVRVGVNYGQVYLDTAEDDVYGFPANLAARLSALAPPGGVVVSDAVEPLIRGAFEVRTRHTAPVRGVEGTVAHYAVSGVNAGSAMPTTTAKAGDVSTMTPASNPERFSELAAP
jgi:class 3 adenylate cyclase